MDRVEVGRTYKSRTIVDFAVRVTDVCGDQVFYDITDGITDAIARGRDFADSFNRRFKPDETGLERAIRRVRR